MNMSFMIYDPNPLCHCQMVGTDLTFCFFFEIWLADRHFLTLQEANGNGQPLWTEESSLSLCFKAKEKTESGTDLQATQSCVGLKERGALSLLTVKIASFTTITLSHEFSTSPTTSSSPPSYTQQLFKRSTTGYIQYRYKCLETRTKKCHIKDGTIFHTVVESGIAHSSHCFSGLWVVQNKAPAEYTPGAAASDLNSCWHSHQQNMKHSAQKHIVIRQNWGCIVKSK